MNSNIEEALSNGFHEAENSNTGMIVIEPAGESGGFIQFEISQNVVVLDFPVLPTNGNSSEDIEFIRRYVSEDVEEMEEEPAGGGGIKVTIHRNIDLVPYVGEIISEIWPDCKSIETELV
jgi:hypothetical protein